MKRGVLCLLAVGLLAGAARGQVTFHLLAWNDAEATAELPSAVGLKPSPAYPTQGDWLLLTADDETLAAGNNPEGALSHNLVDIIGVGGAGFNNAPSLSGDAALTMTFSCMEPGRWGVEITGLTYTGVANPVMRMNEFLVTPGSPPTQVPAMNVDGLGNGGQWYSTAADDWVISYQLDFYFATNLDGNPDPLDVDATFDDKQQTGYLIPVGELTTQGMAAVQLDDPAGFFTGDFEAYLLDEIAPRLPAEATYVLIAQMAKVQPGYVEPGLPITTSSLIGNTTIAYTTQAIPIDGEDGDGDGDVDAIDFGMLYDCLAGPLQTPGPSEPGPCLCLFDTDDDGDVDLVDFAEFQTWFTN